MYKGSNEPRKPKIKKKLEGKLIRVIGDRALRNVRNLFAQGKEDYYKPV